MEGKHVLKSQSFSKVFVGIFFAALLMTTACLYFQPRSAYSIAINSQDGINIPSDPEGDMNYGTKEY